MRDYSFNVQIAVSYGLDEAVFIHALEFWIKKNRANERHFHDGRWWSYNSLSAFGKLFPFWSKRQLERIISSCQKKSLVHVGNYNEDKWKRTTWYALDDCILELYEDLDCISRDSDMHFTKRGNGEHETGKSFNETVINTTVIPPIVPQMGDGHWEDFWRSYPKKVSKPAARRAWAKLKVDEALLSDMLSALERQKRSSAWLKGGGQFIPYPATWLNGRRWEDEADSSGTSTYVGGRASEREELPEWI